MPGLRDDLAAAHTLPPHTAGLGGSRLLAMVLFEKYGQHQPLNRQSEWYAREGVALSLAILADQVGACALALRPLHDLIAAHVLAAERMHAGACPRAGQRPGPWAGCNGL